LLTRRPWNKKPLCAIIKEQRLSDTVDGVNCICGWRIWKRTSKRVL